MPIYPRKDGPAQFEVPSITGRQSVSTQKHESSWTLTITADIGDYRVFAVGIGPTIRRAADMLEIEYVKLAAEARAKVAPSAT